MPKVVFHRSFPFSPNGYEVIQYESGPDPVEVSDRCAEVAIQVGAAEAVDDTPPADSDTPPAVDDAPPAKKSGKRK